MLDEILWYYHMAQQHAPALIETHRDTAPAARTQIVAETYYFYVHNRLPEWTTELEYVEEVRNRDGEACYIFVQRDPSKVN